MLLALLAGTLLATGCGDGRPTRHPVSGRVLIDGEPVKEGYVIVQPSDARAAMGNIGPDGRFTLTSSEENDGCVPGTHAVGVMASTLVKKRYVHWHVPKHLGDPATSDLTVTIDGPKEDWLLELTWGGEKPLIEDLGSEIVDD